MKHPTFPAVAGSVDAVIRAKVAEVTCLVLHEGFDLQRALKCAFACSLTGAHVIARVAEISKAKLAEMEAPL